MYPKRFNDDGHFGFVLLSYFCSLITKTLITKEVFVLEGLFKNHLLYYFVRRNEGIVHYVPLFFYVKITVKIK